MEWLWIIVIVMALIGSLTWILPSPRERVQAKRRADALTLGMKVRIMTLESWVVERLGFDRAAQYLLWCEDAPRSFALWRVPERTDGWVSPPTADSWDLLRTPMQQVLDALPEPVFGVGADGHMVWLAWDDATAGLEPDAIVEILRNMALVVGPKSAGPMLSSRTGFR